MSAHTVFDLDLVAEQCGRALLEADAPRFRPLKENPCPACDRSRSTKSTRTARKLYELIFGDRDPVASPGTATGTPGNWWTVFANVPDCFDHAVHGLRVLPEPASASSRRSSASSASSAPATRAAASSCSRSTARRRARSASARSRSQAIKAWSVATCFSPVERAVLAYTDCLVLEGGRVPDGVFDALAGRAQRRRDPRAHLHHLHLRHARDDEPRAAPRVRRRRRPDAGGGRRRRAPRTT